MTVRNDREIDHLIGFIGGSRNGGDTWLRLLLYLYISEGVHRPSSHHVITCMANVSLFKISF